MSGKVIKGLYETKIKPSECHLTQLKGGRLCVENADKMSITDEIKWEQIFSDPC